MKTTAMENRLKLLETLEASGSYGDRLSLDFIADYGDGQEQWNYTFVCDDGSELVISKPDGSILIYRSNNNEDIFEVYNEVDMEQKYAGKLDDELARATKTINKQGVSNE